MKFYYRRHSTRAVRCGAAAKPATLLAHRYAAGAMPQGARLAGLRSGYAGRST